MEVLRVAEVAADDDQVQAPRVAIGRVAALDSDPLRLEVDVHRFDALNRSHLFLDRGLAVAAMNRRHLVGHCLAHPASSIRVSGEYTPYGYQASIQGWTTGPGANRMQW